MFPSMHIFPFSSLLLDCSFQIFRSTIRGYFPEKFSLGIVIWIFHYLESDYQFSLLYPLSDYNLQFNLLTYSIPTFSSDIISIVNTSSLSIPGYFCSSFLEFSSVSCLVSSSSIHLYFRRISTRIEIRVRFSLWKIY